MKICRKNLRKAWKKIQEIMMKTSMKNSEEKSWKHLTENSQNFQIAQTPQSSLFSDIILKPIKH